MCERTFLGLNDFTRACGLAADGGFDLREANYDGVNFGYWSIEVSRKGMRPRTILWDARDYLVRVMTREAGGEMQDEWIVAVPTHETIGEILSRLREETE